VAGTAGQRHNEEISTRPPQNKRTNMWHTQNWSERNRRNAVTRRQ